MEKRVGHAFFIFPFVLNNTNFQIWKRPTKVLKSQSAAALKYFIFIF